MYGLCIIKQLFLHSEDDENGTNPKVIVDNDDLDIEGNSPIKETIRRESLNTVLSSNKDDETLRNFLSKAVISKGDEDNSDSLSLNNNTPNVMNNDFPLWAGDSSIRRSPEGKRIVFFLN